VWVLVVCPVWVRLMLMLMMMMMMMTTTTTVMCVVTRILRRRLSFFDWLAPHGRIIIIISP
jgi:hypothetical protein